MTPKRVIGSGALSSLERLPVLPEELVQQGAAGGVRKRPEHLVHAEDNR